MIVCTFRKWFVIQTPLSVPRQMNSDSQLGVACLDSPVIFLPINPVPSTLDVCSPEEKTLFLKVGFALKSYLSFTFPVGFIKVK